MRGRGEFIYGDVVYWTGRDGIHACIVLSPELAMLVNPGRGIRLLGAGRDAGPTPDLLAFAVETSGTNVERAARAAHSTHFGFPRGGRTADQQRHDMVCQRLHRSIWNT